MSKQLTTVVWLMAALIVTAGAQAADRLKVS
jgi:hypothetical protein